VIPFLDLPVRIPILREGMDAEIMGRFNPKNTV
jgi:hypothetical protein